MLRLGVPVLFASTVMFVQRETARHSGRGSSSPVLTLPCYLDPNMSSIRSIQNTYSLI